MRTDVGKIPTSRRSSARIVWCVELPQGTAYPKGIRFSAPARFPARDDAWPSVAWSLVVEADSPVAADQSQAVRIRFFAEEAPHHWLESGERFELYEGNLRFAAGIVD